MRGAAFLEFGQLPAAFPQGFIARVRLDSRASRWPMTAAVCS
jgi:hypothetical protein